MIAKATALHIANRLQVGPAPGDPAHIASTGFEEWLDRQLHPQPSQLPESVASVLRSLPSFGKDCGTLYADYSVKAQAPDPKALPREQKKELKRGERRVWREAQIARLVRAVGSPWQLQEALVEFWFNHFNVYGKKGLIKIWVGAYEDQAIRPHTLGRFSDLLLATAKHPAMLIYLDNSRNSAPAPEGASSGMGTARRPKGKARGINENYAREVMELHTLGVDGGYTQADVVSLAHILTGWTVGRGGDMDSATAINAYNDKGAFRFAPRRHDSSPETLLGRTFSGGDEREGEAALLMLASHPATAHHISFQLAQYFVADQPDTALVDAMTRTFRATNGDLRAVVRTMATHEEFLAPTNFGAKFKTPYRYVVSAARATGTAPFSVEPLNAVLEDLGQRTYGCVSPDGYACTQSAWLDPNGLLQRLSFAMRLGAGEYRPVTGANFEPVNPAPLREMLEPVLSAATLSALAQIPREKQAGAILGSPEFMRC
ncbi:MAG TPA: DUF1800 domain-containing protein [Rhizomicrobium sp.]|jgi:uncharacterized protein (DUF1800 family)|nr:DUF1800 domain-containing protein [Rhizomicrobium sp.]